MPEGPMRVPEQANIPAPEHGPVSLESHPERYRPGAEGLPAGQLDAAVLPPPMPAPIAPAVPTDTAWRQKVEDILSDGLEATYKKLDPITQQKFRAEGERTAAEITDMLQSAKFQVQRVIELILNWLRIIPGVNHFFLEQEAKIKADKILTLRQPLP